jgi:ubiquinone/menaquinone biosynthesis C-methylase UbiE
MDPVDLYLQVREREGRLYPDGLVARLPDIPDDHPLAEEWHWRAESSSRLLAYLAEKPGGLDILDLGCGNGWLSMKLSCLRASRVWGVDRNLLELHQAGRVFNKTNLLLFAADITGLPVRRNAFDIIILASVIQYFPDLAALLKELLLLLKRSGEIHILDSPLYASQELSAARDRTRKYYEGLGFPEMAEYYYHHPISALDGFSPHWLRQPGSWRSRVRRFFGRSGSPFPWIFLRHRS